MTGRFDYVKYDGEAVKVQQAIKASCEDLEQFLNDHLPQSTNKERALYALEEFYMWCGKAIRDNQIKRNGSAPLQEDRINS